jgi:hypothetical protein
MQIDKEIRDMLDMERGREARLAEQCKKQFRPWWTQKHPLNVPWYERYREFALQRGKHCTPCKIRRGT